MDDLDRALLAAERLAELCSELIESESDHQTEWDIEARAALTSFRKAMEQEQ